MAQNSAIAKCNVWSVQGSEEDEELLGGKGSDRDFFSDLQYTLNSDKPSCFSLHCITLEIQLESIMILLCVV